MVASSLLANVRASFFFFASGIGARMEASHQPGLFSEFFQLRFPNFHTDTVATHAAISGQEVVAAGD
jgi:hypothetical protein